MAFCAVPLARLGKPFATSGWQLLHSDTHPPEKIFSYSAHLLISDKVDANLWHKCAFVEQAVRTGSILVRMEGIDSPELASIHSGRIIAIERRFLPNIDDGYYWCDLIGLEVFHSDPETGRRLAYGKVQSLSSAGGRHDILKVSCNLSGKVRLIPFVEEVYVKKINLAAGFIEVFWPDDF